MPQVYNLADERSLTLVGYVAFLDPPKETAAPALRALKEHGVEVKVLTGDNELVTSVDIAKDAADIILLEKSLMVLVEGVVEGHRTFVNMLKYIKMTASSNFGNVFSVVIASAFLPFLPLHLLVQKRIHSSA